ncbi:MAG: CRISPR-associated protein Cas4 [Methanomassiliicoccales archaeon]
MEYISASELERYGYCPLSWWLGRKQEVTSEALEEGEKRHDAISKDLISIREQEKKARNWEKVVILFSFVATALALVGLSLMPVAEAQDWSAILGLISVPWILSALYMMLMSMRVKEKERLAAYERWVVLFSIVAAILALNSVTILGVDPGSALIYEVIALTWLIAAVVALYFTLATDRVVKERKRKRDIVGKIRYVGRKESRLLRSEDYGLSGRPDYITEMDGEQIPVEVKTGRTPRGPLFSHILQLAAYCLLLSEENGHRVSHGLLRYDGGEHKIEFTEELEGLLIAKLEEMRELAETGEVHRNHNRAGKCRNCSRRDICPERLV